MKTIIIKNPANGKTATVRANGNESLHISKSTAIRILAEIGAKNPLDCFVDGEDTLHVDGLAGFPPRASHASNEAIGEDIRKYLATLGRKGGSAKSETKAEACRQNAKKPRPSAKRFPFWVLSGEGENGTWKRVMATKTGIKRILTRERCGGERWAYAYGNIYETRDGVVAGLEVVDYILATLPEEARKDIAKWAIL